MASQGHGLDSTRPPQSKFRFQPPPPSRPPPPILVFPVQKHLLPSQIQGRPPPHPTPDPIICSALFLPQHQVENTNDQAKAEADPGQDEAVAVVALQVMRCPAVRVVVSIDGHPNQNAQPCRGQTGSALFLNIRPRKRTYNFAKTQWENETQLFDPKEWFC